MDDLYTLKEFAELKKVSINTVRTWIRNGLPTIRPSWHIQISLADYNSWLESCREVHGQRVAVRNTVLINPDLVAKKPTGKFGIKKIV